MAFVIGQLVRLKSGGPQMTVTGEVRDLRGEVAYTVTVAFASRLQTHVFLEKELTTAIEPQGR